MVGPLVAGQVLGSAGAVLVFIVVFCSLASSIDSLLAATSDLLAEDVYRRWLDPGANDAQVRKLTSSLVIGLGLVTWLLCLPRFADLIVVLFLAGPLVASTIWPIAAGLYWRRTHRLGALAGMLLGSAVGLFAYFNVGWFTGSLIGGAVSAAIVALTTWLAPAEPFDWGDLDESTLAGELPQPSNASSGG
jgi:Na+/proline symporter